MPELPEVETIRKQLDKTLKGQKILKIEKHHPKSLQGDSFRAIGKTIVEIKRKAKTIWIDLTGDCNLLIHLKMTGQLLINAEPGKYTRVIIHLSKDRLIFNDLRIFGWIKIVDNKTLKAHLDKLPPDVIDKAFTVNYLEKVLAGSRRPVKLVITDQAKIGGVGNIYANDGLFCAKINPRTPANKITRIKELHDCLLRVIKRGIKFGGSTAKDENYVDAFGKRGQYQTKFLIYEQQGKKCQRCGTAIQKIKLGGRGTYFCPHCQS
jgi:formamidopyrimidine-DNA glycosylase